MSHENSEPLNYSMQQQQQQQQQPNHFLTDDEIRRRLIEDFNFPCGPVTPQTRRILLIKLNKLENERSQSGNNSIDRDHNNDEIHHHVNGQDGGDLNGNKDFNDLEIVSEPIIFEKPSHQTSTPINTNRQSARTYSPRRKTKDEEEAVKTFKEVEKTLKETSFSGAATSEPVKISKSSKYANKKASPVLNEYSSEGSDNEDVQNISIPPPSVRTSTPNTLPSSLNTARIAAARITPEDRTPFRSPSSLSRAPIRRSGLFESNKKLPSSSSLLNFSDSESDNEYSSKKEKICQMLLNHRPGVGRSVYKREDLKKPSIFSKISNMFQSIKRRFGLPFVSKKDTGTHYSTSSNYVSFALLLFVVIFFLVIFSIYFYSKFTHASRYTLDLNDYAFIEDKSKLLAPICGSTNDSEPDCLQFETDQRWALNIVKEIKSYIDKQIYKAYCGNDASPNTIPDIESFVFKKNDFQHEIQMNLAKNYASDSVQRDKRLSSMDENKLFAYDFNNAFKLIHLNTAWNMKVDEGYFSELSLTSNYKINLPIHCLVRLFFQKHFLSIIATVIAILISFISLTYYRYSKHREIQEQEMVYDLIEKSMELLQSPDEPQSMPVLHIRDTLLSPAEKKCAKYKRIWSKVVDHIESAESRVKVEYKKIDGEEFKSWKWIASTSSPYVSDTESENESLAASSSQTQKISGVEWQGQAFAFSDNKQNTSATNESVNNQRQGRQKEFQALTLFLKIRNIFEREAQYVDQNYTTKIKNTILLKTAKISQNGTHDIVHIEIDDRNKEGLVYLKCASLAGATNVFHALHGWWCEKKLVSVKFLKEDRYYDRFPHARHLNTPLTITSFQ